MKETLDLRECYLRGINHVFELIGKMPMARIARARELFLKEGFFVRISSGSAICRAICKVKVQIQFPIIGTCGNRSFKYLSINFSDKRSYQSEREKRLYSPLVVKFE